MASRETLKQLAEVYNCSESSVYRTLKKFNVDSDIDKISEEQTLLVQAELEKLKKKNDSVAHRSVCTVSGYSGCFRIYSNAILKCLVNHSYKNDYTDGYKTGFTKYQYMYKTHDKLYEETLGLVMDDTKDVFTGIRFREQLILSAFYSQIENMKPEPDGRYKVSLRSIYEFLHGSGTEWSKVSVQDRYRLSHEISRLVSKLSHFSGVYTCKNERGKAFSIHVDNAFFLSGCLYKDLTRQQEEQNVHAQEGMRNLCYYCRYPGILSMNRKQGRVHRIPQVMLECRMNNKHATLKTYLAYRVFLGNDDRNHMKRTIRYNDMERKCGLFDRDVVKRYMRYLQDKGIIENLRLDKDAVRWDKPV